MKAISSRSSPMHWPPKMHLLLAEIRHLQDHPSIAIVATEMDTIQGIAAKDVKIFVAQLILRDLHDSIVHATTVVFKGTSLKTVADALMNPGADPHLKFNALSNLTPT